MIAVARPGAIAREHDALVDRLADANKKVDELNAKFDTLPGLIPRLPGAKKE